MRKIFDSTILLLIAGFSFFYVTNTSFREAVIAEIQTIQSRPIAENLSAIPLEAKRAVIGGCPAPITYRIDAIDPRFGATREQVIQAANAAAKEWNDAAGSELFAFRDDGAMPVSLIYDDRQELAVAIASETGTLQNQEDKLRFVQRKYDSLKQTVLQKTESYQKDVKRYESALKDFEDEVRKYEANPETYTQDVYDRLQEDRKKLQERYSDVDKARKSINALVDELNALAKSANMLGDSFNSHVNEYNASVNEKQQIQEDFAGVYFSDRRIEVYQFLSTEELQSVLVHEMGHALGFDHSTDPNSVMYATEREGQIMTNADKQLAKNLCMKKISL